MNAVVERDQWIQELQKGDKVIVANNDRLHPNHIDTVDRVTKTQVILAGSISKYRRDNGVRIETRGAWDTLYFLKQVTTEAIAETVSGEIRHKLDRKFRSFDWKKLTTDQLHRIDAIVSEGEAV